MFFFSVDLVAHIDEHRKIKIDDKVIWRCDICTETFENHNQFLTHTKSHQKPLKCPKCTNTYGVLSLLRYHVQTMHNMKTNTLQTVKCSHCEQKFTSNQMLKQHIARKHVLSFIEKMQNNTALSHCWKTFKTPEELEAHRQMTHKRFKCDICREDITGSTESFRSHRSWHLSKTQNHKCDVSEDFFF